MDPADDDDDPFAILGEYFLPPLCSYCARISAAPGPPHCTAFPGGIPRAIFALGFDHREPYPGDHGLRYAPKPGGPP